MLPAEPHITEAAAAGPESASRSDAIAIPYVYRAEHPSNPDNNFDTRQAQFPSDGKREQPGHIQPPLRFPTKLIPVPGSNKVKWGFCNAKERQKYEERQREQRMQLLQPPQILQPTPEKIKQTRKRKPKQRAAKRVKVNNTIDNTTEDVSGNAIDDTTEDVGLQLTNEDCEPDNARGNNSVNTFNSGGIHVDRLHRMLKSGFKGEARADIIEKA
ncbi:hypothetical protein FN846DRAFT_176940, partial [Sphaerosporella brunnea]